MGTDLLVTAPAIRRGYEPDWPGTAEAIDFAAFRASGTPGCEGSAG
jgi:hypothetical protein